MLEAVLAIAAIVVFIAIVQRGRRLREREEAGLTFGELLNRQDFLILDIETTGLGKGAEVVEIAVVDTTGATLLSTVVMPVWRINSEASDIHGLTRARSSGSSRPGTGRRSTTMSASSSCSTELRS